MDRTHPDAAIKLFNGKMLLNDEVNEWKITAKYIDAQESNKNFKKIYILLMPSRNVRQQMSKFYQIEVNTIESL